MPDSVNPNIKRLAIEHDCSNILFTREGHYHEVPAKINNFAQAVVSECIDLVSSGGEFASRPRLVELLREHFGIEE